MKNDFSLTAMIKAKCADTWGRQRLHEYDESQRLNEQYGPAHGSADRIPDTALRDLNVASGSQGGYTVATSNIGYLPTLQPVSVALQLGAQQVTIDRDAAALPRGTTAVTTAWLTNETTQIAESTPAFGQITGAPKLLGAFCEISRQLLLQSNAEEVVRLEFRNAAAPALDAAILAGSGASGQPTGITNTAGVGSFTGGTLNRSALTDAQLDVATANAVINPATLGYATTPAVANLLANRADTVAEEGVLWKGGLNAGTVIGTRALSTTGCPSATAIYGDWASVYVVSWAGGLAIEVDPFTKFTSGIVGVRLIMACDVFVTRAAAFSVATSIT